MNLERETLEQVIALLREALQLFPAGCSGLKEDLRWILDEAEDSLEGMLREDVSADEMYL